MAVGERQKAFRGRRAMSEVGLEHALHPRRGILRLHVAIKLAADHGIGPETAADEDVIALDRVAALARLDLAREQTDFADAVLGTGMVTAGEMDVDRSIELDAGL